MSNPSDKSRWLLWYDSAHFEGCLHVCKPDELDDICASLVTVPTRGRFRLALWDQEDGPNSETIEFDTFQEAIKFAEEWLLNHYVPAKLPMNTKMWRN